MIDNIPDHMSKVDHYTNSWTCHECGSIVRGVEARDEHECSWLRDKRAKHEKKYMTEDGLLELTSRHEGNQIVFTLTTTKTYQDRLTSAINSLIKVFRLIDQESKMEE